MTVKLNKLSLNIKKTNFIVFRPKVKNYVILLRFKLIMSKLTWLKHVNFFELLSTVLLIGLII